MTSTINLINRAFILLGGQGINSFEDATNEAEIAGALFESVYEDVLTESRWNFATKNKVLNRLSETESTVEDWKYSFLLPPDMLLLNKANIGVFDIQGDKLYCNYPDVEIEYTFKPEVSNLPPWFLKALEYRLASEFAIPLTGDQNKAGYYFQMYVTKLKKSRYNDASSDTNSVPGLGTYVTKRY
jgi:hypothetical protein